MELNQAAGTNDTVRGLTSITYGGLLVVTNLASESEAGDSFTLSKTTSYSDSFAATNMPPLGLGLACSFNPATGTPRVVSTAPTNITTLVSGNRLTLSWPPSHIGWQLQTQTNAPGTGLGTNWVGLPPSIATNQMSFTIDPANGSVFYRMIFPPR